MGGPVNPLSWRGGKRAVSLFDGESDWSRGPSVSVPVLPLYNNERWRENHDCSPCRSRVEHQRDGGCKAFSDEWIGKKLWAF